MKISKTYAIMFGVEDGGVSNPISWGKENLKPENIIMVIDEENLTVWLWHGKKRGLVSRRTALRQAESLKGHGYTVGKSIVGRGMEKIIEIDQRKIGRDPETNENNDKFMELLNRKVTDVGNFIVTFGNGGGEESIIETKPKSQSEVKKDIAMKVQPFSPSGQSEPMVPPPKTPPVEVSAPVLKPKPQTETKDLKTTKSEPESKSIVLKPAPKPEPKPEPKPTPRPTLTHVPKPAVSNGFNGSSANANEYDEDIEIPSIESTVQEKPKTSQELLSTHEEAQMGLVIMAVMNQFKDIWVSKKDDGKVIIEQMDGRVCSFSIVAGKVKFEPGSFSEIDPVIKDAIHNRFNDLIKGLK